MSETRELLATLKKCLRARGLTYRDVARSLGISEPSVKRIFAERTFSLERLEKVCRLIDMSVYDLARLTRQRDTQTLTRLTLVQEQGLADDPLVLTYFYLLLTGRTPETIADEFGLDDAQQNDMLVRLHRLDLVELRPVNTARLLTGKRIDWRADGPILRKYKAEVIEAFFNSRFRAEIDYFRFESGELSRASIETLIKKLGRLTKEFAELAELDTTVPDDARRAMGLVVGLRAWTFWHLLEPMANDIGLNPDRPRAS